MCRYTGAVEITENPHILAGENVGELQTAAAGDINSPIIKLTGDIGFLIPEIKISRRIVPVCQMFQEDNMLLCTFRTLKCLSMDIGRTYLRILIDCQEFPIGQKRQRIRGKIPHIRSYHQWCGKHTPKGKMLPVFDITAAVRAKGHTALSMKPHDQHVQIVEAAGCRIRKIGKLAQGNIFHGLV